LHAKERSKDGDSLLRLKWRFIEAAQQYDALSND
jgi:hypothetical protein